MANFLGLGGRRPKAAVAAAPSYTPAQMAARRQAAGVSNAQLGIPAPARPPVVVATRQGPVQPATGQLLGGGGITRDPDPAMGAGGQLPGGGPLAQTQAQRMAFAGINPGDVMSPADQAAAKARSAAAWQQMGVNPADLGLGGPQDKPTPPVDPMAEFLKMLPKESSYVGPYDQAAKAANDAYGAAVPQLNSVYDDLAKQLAASGKDFDTTAANDRSSLAARYAALTAAQQQDGQGGLDSLKSLGVDVPTLLDRYQGDAKQAAAGLTQDTQDQLGLQDRLAQVGKQSNDSRVADAQLSKSNHLANAQQNLTDQLASIASDRAGAERAYQKDNLSGNLNIEQMRLKLQDSQQKQIDQLTKQHKTTASQQFIKDQMPAILAKQPAGADLLSRLQKQFGAKGELSRQKIVQHLVDHAGELSSGSYVLESAHGQAAIAKLQADHPPFTKVVVDGDHAQLQLNRHMNPSQLTQWINQLYDDSETLPPEVQAQVDALNSRH